MSSNNLFICGGKAKIQKGLGMSDDAFHCMVAQLSHFAWSVSVLTWGAILVPKYFYWVYGVWVLLTAAKEFWFDFNIFTWQPGFEDNVQSGGPAGDVLDFSFYVLGGLVAYAALLCRGMLL